METLVDLLDDCAGRFADKPALGLRRDDGTTFHWTYAEVRRRSRLAAWRLARSGLQPGDRVLTWSPSTPALPAAYYGVDDRAADLRPARRADERGRDQNIVEASGATRLLLGTGRDAPGPARGGAGAVPDHDDRVAERGPGRHVPARLGGAGRRLGPPEARRGLPARVHQRHDRQPEGRDARPRQLAGGRPELPRDHQADGAPDGLAAPPVAQPGAGGQPVLRDERRRAHPVRPVAQPAGHLRQPARAPGHDDAARSAGGGPVLERHRARGGEAGPGGAVRPAPADRPAAPLLGAAASCSASVHEQLGGGLRLFATAGAFLPPALQQAWEDMGVIVLQGYGATETAAGSATTMADHPLGCVGWPPKPVEMRIADDGEIQFRGPDAVQGLLEQPGGHGRRLHRGRLVQERRPRASSTTRAGSTSTAARRT